MTLLAQTPTPPVPPETHMVLGGSLNDATVGIILLAAFITVGMLLWPLVRALARRLESGGRSAQLQEELDALRDRLRQVEQSQVRMAELEERVDFAERMLAHGRDPDRLRAEEGHRA